MQYNTSILTLHPKSYQYCKYNMCWNVLWTDLPPVEGQLLLESVDADEHQHGAWRSPAERNGWQQAEQEEW